MNKLENRQDDIFISVALCTHNHADRLSITLNDLKPLEHPSKPWELLIVDNASTDNTPKLLATEDWRPDGVPVRIVQEQKLGIANARNRAAIEARGEYLVFIDDDETADPQWLTTYEREMLAHSPDALGGRIEVLFEQGDRPAWLQDELLGFLGQLNHGKQRWLTDSSTLLYTGNFAVRRKVIEQIGPFDTSLGRKGRSNTGGEDTDFYRRLLANNQRVLWVPTAIIHHRIRSNKLRRSYFLDLHYQLGLLEGSQQRKASTRIPPKYLLGQLLRSVKNMLKQRLTNGKDQSLRMEMNTVYFIGNIVGWIKN